MKNINIAILIDDNCMVIKEENMKTHTYDFSSDETKNSISQLIIDFLTSKVKDSSEERYLVKISLSNIDELKESVIEKIDKIELSSRVEVEFEDTLNVAVENTIGNFEGKRVYYVWIDNEISGKLIWENGEELKRKYLDKNSLGIIGFESGRIDSFHSFRMIKAKALLTSGIEITNFRDLVIKGKEDKNIRILYEEFRDSIMKLLATIILHLEPDTIVLGGPKLEGTNIRDIDLFEKELGSFFPVEYLSNIEWVVFGYDKDKILNQILS